jgi:hypothetical protein
MRAAAHRGAKWCNADALELRSGIQRFRIITTSDYFLTSVNIK